MGYPDNHSGALQDAAQGTGTGCGRPPYTGPAAADLSALRRAHTAYVTAIATITGHEWEYDFVSTCSHADLLLDMRWNLRILGDAIAEAQLIMRDGGMA